MPAPENYCIITVALEPDVLVDLAQLASAHGYCNIQGLVRAFIARGSTQLREQDAADPQRM